MDTCKIPKDQETVTIEENGKPPMTIIHEGPTQPEERVQMNDALEKAEEAAAEDEDSECTKPEQSGSFAPGMKSFMHFALKEAEEALKEKEVPIGAVVICNGEVIAKAHNQKELLNDPTAHAEILALREAALKKQDWRLEGCEIYVTHEPCPMCLGALMQTRIKRLVYGAPEPEYGAVESRYRLGQEFVSNRDLEIYPGILEEECKELIQRFFKNQRKAKNGA